MASYEIAALTTSTTAGGASVELVAATNPMVVLEFGVFATSATANNLILGRPGNTPAGGTSVKATEPTDLSSTTDSLGGYLLSGQSTAPTIPAAGASLRMFNTAAIGAGVVWTWEPGELVVSASSRALGLILWQTANSPQRFYVKWTE